MIIVKYLCLFWFVLISGIKKGALRRNTVLKIPFNNLRLELRVLLFSILSISRLAEPLQQQSTPPAGQSQRWM